MKRRAQTEMGDDAKHFEEIASQQLFGEMSSAK
jgi:hypothetical protein